MQLPQPTGDFVWTQESWGPALRCSPLLEHAPHFFTTRALSLGGGSRAALDAWTQVAEAIEVSPERLLRLRQVHGATVVTVSPGLAPHPRDAWPEGDAAVTDDPLTALGVRVADCVPLLLADPRTGAVGAVHAGWRGAAAGVAPATVRALTRSFEARAADVVAAIGPSIGPCCYVVGPELIDQFAAHAEAAAWFVRGSGGRWRLDLWRAIRDQLVRTGVAAQNILTARLCTACRVDVFCSFRTEGAQAGRMAGVIRAARRRPQAAGR